MYMCKVVRQLCQITDLHSDVRQISELIWYQMTCPRGNCSSAWRVPLSLHRLIRFSFSMSSLDFSWNGMLSFSSRSGRGWSGTSTCWTTPSSCFTTASSLSDVSLAVGTWNSSLSRMFISMFVTTLSGSSWTPTRDWNRQASESIRKSLYCLKRARQYRSASLINR